MEKGVTNMQQNILIVHDSLEEQNSKLIFLIASLTSITALDLSGEAIQGLCEILRQVNDSIIDARETLANNNQNTIKVADGQEHAA